MSIALIDADIVAYRCAASANNDPLDIALVRVDELMQRILHETASEHYFAYLTGSNNFRYDIYPEYKANRKDTEKPKWLQDCREHLVLQWKASVTDGIEADDAMSMEQTKNSDTIICSIDKDLLQVPGRHYNFVKQEFKTISPKEGLFNFYWQFIMGDKADNIPGFDGKMRDKIPKFLEPMYNEMQLALEFGTEVDLFDIVRGNHTADDALLLALGRCLYMLREPDKHWEFPSEKT